MTRRLVVATVVALGIQVGISAQSGAIIEGVVLDSATNEPLAGVQLTLYPTETPVENSQEAPKPTVQVTTDPQGRFSILTHETGRFRVVPTKAGFVFSKPGEIRAPTLPGAWVQLSLNTRIEALELRMVRPATITGRVVDSDGRPNLGRVNLLRYTYDKEGKRSLSSIPGSANWGRNPWQFMNDQGEFRFYDLPPGEYYLAVAGDTGIVVDPGLYYYPGVVDETKAVPIRVGSGEEARIGTLSLPPRQTAAELRLRITGAAGRPMAPKVRLGDSVVGMTSLSNSGEIAIPVAPGHYDIVVGDDGPITRLDYHYARFAIDVGSTNVTRDVVLKPAPRLTGFILLENAGGERRAAPPSILCKLDGRYRLNCLDSRPEEGSYGLEFQGLPADVYVLSAKAGDHDILAEGLSVTGDTQLEIVLAPAGGIVHGTVRTSTGDVVPDATVALVPEAPYRGAGPRYRSVITDHKGQFEIHGIAPASYKLFAWSDLEGAAYRNSDFMREFEDRGKPVDVQKGTRTAVDLAAF